MAPAMTSTETQRVYLKETDQTVKKAIAAPISFSEEHTPSTISITSVQAEAILDGISEVFNDLKNYKKTIDALSENERNILNETVNMIVDSKGENVPISLALLEDPVKIVELLNIAMQEISLASRLAKKDVNLREYTSPVSSN